MATNISSGGEKSKQSSETSENVTARRRANTRLAQNVLLIWLDNRIDENGDEESHDAIKRLRRVNNNISTFTDSTQCIEFINTITNEKICMITSGSLGQLIVPKVHGMSQVDSIFVFCGNKQMHEQWAKNWPKTKGVFTEISQICKAVKQAAEQCEHNATSISFLPINDGTINKNVNQVDYSFTYTQVLKEILLTIPFEEKHIKVLTDYCRELFVENDHELENVNKLEHHYREQTPIWWYMYESFLYPMLNRALRVMDVDIIIKMGFFISDLQQYIEKLCSEQFNTHQQSQVFIFYRAQTLSKADFDQMVKTKDGLMSFNNFLSASKNSGISFDSATRTLSNTDDVAILFKMVIDPSKSSTPFAFISNINDDESVKDEILFSMHTVFRIRDIKSIDEHNRQWQVTLILVDDNDQELHSLTECIRQETFPDAQGWGRLGQFLRKQGQSDKAQQVYEVMLEQETDYREKATIYYQLGLTKSDQGKYEEAIKFYERSLEIKQGTLPPNHPDLANAYNNIGEAYRKMDEYRKAFSYYEKGLEIFQKTLPPNHPHLTESYNNIGEMYCKMKEYSQSLSSYQKALEIFEKTLPSNHPHLAESYNNIAAVYLKMNEYPQALSFYEKVLEIRQHTLSPKHPDLASSYSNIGNVFFQMKELPKALSYYDKACEIFQKALSPSHHDIAVSYYNLGLVHESMGDYSRASSLYERAVDIGQSSLSITHPHLQQWREHLENVKKLL